MVRKRSRTNRNKKTFRDAYDSEDNDSDVELNLESPPSSPPGPKRYGLRKRKQPVFFPDYECDEEDEDDPDVIVNNTHSDDDEYDIENDLEHVKLKLPSRQPVVRGTNKNNIKKEQKNELVVKTTVVTTEKEKCKIQAIKNADAPADDNALIDFEDVIRADVVVNKQVVDHDNTTNKSQTEIDHQNNISESSCSNTSKEKAKRGRKRKSKPLVDEIFEANSSDTVKAYEEDNMPLEVHIDPSSLVQSDDSESDDDKPLIKRRNGIRAKHALENESAQSNSSDPDSPKENGVVLAESWVNKIEKYVPPSLDENEREVFLSNEYLLANAFDIGADEFRENREKIMELPNEIDDQIMPSLDFDNNAMDSIDEDSSDDVVIIEKKPEVIVLDDD